MCSKVEMWGTILVISHRVIEINHLKFDDFDFHRFFLTKHVLFFQSCVPVSPQETGDFYIRFFFFLFFFLRWFQPKPARFRFRKLGPKVGHHFGLGGRWGTPNELAVALLGKKHGETNRSFEFGRSTYFWISWFLNQSQIFCVIEMLKFSQLCHHLRWQAPGGHPSLSA